MSLTIKITDPHTMVDFIRSVGTGCQFVSMKTETEVKMRKTGNPFVGAVKVSRRNGLINVNFVESVKRKLTELNGEKTDYVAGSTWYRHEMTEDGKPLALCVHSKDNQKFYLQYFPNRTLGRNEYFLNGRKLTAAEVAQMKTFITEKETAEHKPRVITLAMASIRELKARNIKLLNNTADKLAKKMSDFSFTVQPATPATAPVSV